MKLQYFLLQLFILALLGGCTAESMPQLVEVQAQVATATPVAPTATVTEVASPTPIPQPTATMTPAGSVENCPVTQPPKTPFIPPSPYPPQPSGDYFWSGTNAFWTAVPSDGVWSGLPHNPEGYTQKIFWWSEGYSWTEEPEPELSVTGRRLDGPAPSLIASRATNAFAADIQSAMLVGVDFPTLGCWEISGHYRGHELSFVVWIDP